MIQDIAPHRLDNQFRIQAPKPADFALYYENNKGLLRKEGDRVRIPTIQELSLLDEEVAEHAEYGFSIDDTAYYLLTSLRLPEEVSGYEFFDNRIYREMEPSYQGFAGITASQIWRWKQGRRFCGRCGSQTVNSETERAMVCPECGAIEYPKISPAVIVAITNGDKILMSRYVGRPYGGYALIAGFVEIGESFEETVRREVMEEVGLKVTNIRYYKSQPWSFSDSEMIGFFAELDGDDTITLQEDELAEAGWYTRDDISEDEASISIANEMKLLFKYGKHELI